MIFFPLDLPMIIAKKMTRIVREENRVAVREKKKSRSTFLINENAESSPIRQVTVNCLPDLTDPPIASLACSGMNFSARKIHLTTLPRDLRRAYIVEDCNCSPTPQSVPRRTKINAIVQSTA